MCTAITDNKAKPDSKNPEAEKESELMLQQRSIDKSWKTSTANTIPNDLEAKRDSSQPPQRILSSQDATASYEQAVATCRAKVAGIVRECRRLNQKIY